MGYAKIEVNVDWFDEDGRAIVSTDFDPVEYTDKGLVEVGERVVPASGTSAIFGNQESDQLASFDCLLIVNLDPDHEIQITYTDSSSKNLRCLPKRVVCLPDIDTAVAYLSSPDSVPVRCFVMAVADDA